jgi:hypothetical protein
MRSEEGEIEFAIFQIFGEKMVSNRRVRGRMRLEDWS